MSTALKLSGSIQGTNRKLYLNLFDAEAGKTGLSGFLNEVVDGVRLPGHRVNVFKNGNDENAWLTISAPLRVHDEDGNFITQPRINADGSFVNDKGEVVDSEEKAARQFEYVKYKENENDAEERILYGTIATMNVKNEKSDGKPTAFTMLNTKLYSDAEAMEIARKMYELRQLEEGSAERKEVEEELSVLRRETGTWMTLFIDSGHEKLRDMGFDIRAREVDGPAPK